MSPYRTSAPTPEGPERVFCKGCRFLSGDKPREMVCLASPAGDVSPIDGRQLTFHLAIVINIKYDCKLRENGEPVQPPEGAIPVTTFPPRLPPPKLPDPPPIKFGL
jgi:hypothetical protein